MNRKIYDACEYVKNLRFLSKTAMELVEFTPGKDIYKFVRIGFNGMVISRTTNVYFHNFSRLFSQPFYIMKTK